MLAASWPAVAQPVLGGGGGSVQPQLEQNTDRPGSDYSFFDVSNGGPMVCFNACMADGNCQAFTLVRPSVQAPEARCFLKHSVSPAVANACCVSGVRTSRVRQPGRP
jgi:hypothetical protein